mmetsp:Transcript_11166/g.35445  ORF Transcript_11166/g.35445 Transcript_11166/m.35445 type:complete len:278 (+) Transcript_11166:659-1492(+)
MSFAGPPMMPMASTAQKRTSQSPSERLSATSASCASAFMAPSATSAAHLGLRMAIGSRAEPPPTWRGSQVRSSSVSLRRAATSAAWEAAFTPQFPRHSAAQARTAGLLSLRSSLSLPAEAMASSGSLARMASASARVCESLSHKHLATSSPATGLQASSPNAARALTAENRVSSLSSFFAMSPAMLAPPRVLRARQAAPCTSGDLSDRSPVTVDSWSVAPIMPKAWMATTLACSSAGCVSAMSFASLSPYLRPASPKAPMAPAAAPRTFALAWARGR